MDLKAELLASELFSGLPVKLANEAAALAVERRFSPGDTLFREAALAEMLFVVTEGQVRLRMQVRRLRDTMDVDLTTVGPQQAIGLWALLPPYRYGFTGIAMTAVACAAMDARPLRAFLAANPAMELELSRRCSLILSERLQQTREVLAYERALRAI